MQTVQFSVLTVALLPALLVQAETERLRLSALRLEQGVASQLDLLDAQRALFSAQQALLQTRLALAQNQVALYKALGGGWKTPG